MGNKHRKNNVKRNERWCLKVCNNLFWTQKYN